MSFINFKTIRFALFALISCVLLESCGGLESQGVMKNANTGVETHWKISSPETVILEMNGEELGHTDIPLGESFALTAKNVRGLVGNNGKILVGCALIITDTSGKQLMNEADLFAGNGEFALEKEQFLRCIISTGAPMQWENNYNVDVRFWDKNGKGTIESKFTIRMIDIP